MFFMDVVILVFISSVFNLKDGFFPEGFYTNFMEVKIYKKKHVYVLIILSTAIAHPLVVGEVIGSNLGPTPRQN